MYLRCSLWNNNSMSENKSLSAAFENFGILTDPIDIGVLPKCESPYEVHHLSSKHCDKIALATHEAGGVVTKPIAKIEEHFDVGGAGIGIFVGNEFAGQALFRTSDLKFEDAKVDQLLLKEHFKGVSHDDSLAVSTVSSVAPTPFGDAPCGFATPLLKSWYEHAQESGTQLLQACVQVDNTKGENLFTRNGFFSDESVHTSPSGTHDVYFMYRVVAQDVPFDTRHISIPLANIDAVAPPSIPEPAPVPMAALS